jgi:hypothetical protein
MYKCIYRCLFDMVIYVHGYKQDKIIRMIKSRRMESAVHGTRTCTHMCVYTHTYIYICVYTHIYIYVCVCVRVCVCKIFVRKL